MTSRPIDNNSSPHWTPPNYQHPQAARTAAESSSMHTSYTTAQLAPPPQYGYATDSVGQVSSASDYYSSAPSAPAPAGNSLTYSSYTTAQLAPPPQYGYGTDSNDRASTNPLYSSGASAPTPAEGSMYPNPTTAQLAPPNLSASARKRTRRSTTARSEEYLKKNRERRENARRSDKSRSEQDREELGDARRTIKELDAEIERYGGAASQDSVGGPAPSYPHASMSTSFTSRQQKHTLTPEEYSHLADSYDKIDSWQRHLVTLEDPEELERHYPGQAKEYKAERKRLRNKLSAENSRRKKTEEKAQREQELVKARKAIVERRTELERLKSTNPFVYDPAAGQP